MKPHFLLTALSALALTMLGLSACGQQTASNTEDQYGAASPTSDYAANQSESAPDAAADPNAATTGDATATPPAENTSSEQPTPP